MKKKWLVSIGMVVALITGLLTTSVALAAKPETFEFEAPGFAYIAGDYESWQTGPVQHAIDEPVDGQFGECLDWPQVSFSSFATLHDGVIVLNPQETVPGSGQGTFKGSLHGTFTIITADELGGIEGNIRGKVSGTWNLLDPEDPTNTYIEDCGTFTSTKGFGTLAGVKVRGTWWVRLDWDPVMETYFGEITIEGTHH